MLTPGGDHRFYGELASWWPLISPPEEYVEEAAVFSGLLDGHSRPVMTVLELGSGGGHNASHLKTRFAMTLVDLSDEMLDVSRALNPECTHLHGDMRELRLGHQFDAVFIHDAIDYMTTEADLRRAVATAFAHCRPGGIALFVPDDTVETFSAATDHGGGDAMDGRGARYLAWTWDPDPDDTSTLTEYAFVLRETDGRVRTVHETHRCGLFPRTTWLAVLTDAGFAAEGVVESTDDHAPREMFIGRRPGEI
jgi:SAM-dependent methyltransferase